MKNTVEVTVEKGDFAQGEDNIVFVRMRDRYATDDPLSLTIDQFLDLFPNEDKLKKEVKICMAIAPDEEVDWKISGFEEVSGVSSSPAP